MSSNTPNPDRSVAEAQIAGLDAVCERIALPLQGQHVVWRKVGSGRPLVLLHGGHGCWLHWARMIPDLSAHFTLYLPDLPGYGESTLEPSDGLHALVNQLQASLDALVGAQTQVLLAGFSFGGLVGAQLAVQRGHVKRLVLIGPAGHGSRRRQTELPLPWRHLDPQADPGPWAERMRHNLLAQMLHSESAVDELAMEIQWRGCLNTRFHSKPFSRSAALAPALRQLNADCLQLWAEHDVTATPDELVDEAVPGGAFRKRLVVGSAGHWLMHECPAQTAQLMVDGLGDD